MKLRGDFMGLFNLFKKNNVVPKAEEKTVQKTSSNTFFNPAVESHQPTKPWVDRYYMSGYDVGEVKGYTDLMEKPSCDEEGTEAPLKWERYGDFVIITGVTDKNAQSVEIPDAINGYTVIGIERMALLYCNIQTITIPDTITYIGGMAVGFTSKSPFSDEEERQIRAMKPFAENWPTSPFMNKNFYLHINPKTVIIGAKNSIAEKYAASHYLPFSVR